MTRKISPGNFVLLCVLGSGVGGVGITPLYRVSEVWAAPKGMAFGLFMSEKALDFIHIGNRVCFSP